MKRETVLILRGVGIGMIITATLFFIILTFYVPSNQGLSNMNDNQIIERAREMGMIFVSELNNGQSTGSTVSTKSNKQSTDGTSDSNSNKQITDGTGNSNSNEQITDGTGTNNE